MIFLPVFLSLALAIGYSIHVFNFFTRRFLQTVLRSRSIIHALVEVGWPLLFSALTTITAILTFLFIPMQPIRWVGLTAVCLAGFFRLDIFFDIRRTYGPKIPCVERLEQIGKTSVGSLYSYGVTLEFDEPRAAREPENLEKIDRLAAQVQSFRITKKVSSLLDIIKDMNQVANAGDPSCHHIPGSQKMIAQLLLLYENAGGAEAEKYVDYEYQRPMCLSTWASWWPPVINTLQQSI